MKPFVLLLSLLLGVGCQSSSRSQKLAAMKPTERTYASFARQRIETSGAQLLEILEGVTTLDAKTANEILLALGDWRETLSLFIHVFPRSLDYDPYFDLLQEAESGIFLIEKSFDEDAIMWWVQHMVRSLRSDESQTYRMGLNDAFAARRKASLLPLFYWSGVNFIPALNGGVDSNLQDYFAEQRSTLRREMSKVLDLDPLFPDQARDLEAIYARTRILISLDKKYRLLDRDFMFRREIRSTQEFCESALRDLAAHGRLREAKDEARATILSLKIRKDWQAEKARKFSRAQTERDHQHGRD